MEIRGTIGGAYRHRLVALAAGRVEECYDYFKVVPEMCWALQTHIGRQVPMPEEFTL